MQELMNWDIPDENRSLSAPTPPTTAPAVKIQQKDLPSPEPQPTVWFIDVWENNAIRQGTILRTIIVRDRLARPQTEMQYIKLELVSYTDDSGKPQLDVISPSRHVRPKPSVA